MSRYRRELTRPEIARLAEETTELRRELQDLVRGRRKPDRANDLNLGRPPTKPEGNGIPSAPARRNSRKRR